MSLGKLIKPVAQAPVEGSASPVTHHNQFVRPTPLRWSDLQRRGPVEEVAFCSKVSTLSAMNPRDLRHSTAKTPLYRALQAELQREILSGRLKAGDWLPSENELARDHGVSVTSVRRALLELRRLGLIERFQGRGSVVASNELRATSPMLGLGRELRHRGFNVRPEVISSTEEPVPEQIAVKLELDEASPMQHIRRRYLLAETILVVLEHYLPPRPGIDYREFAGDSFYAFLAVRNALPTHAHERVSAIDLSADDAALLDVPEGRAALLRERTSFLADRTPVEYTRYIFRADSYHMEMDLEMHS